MDDDAERGAVALAALELREQPDGDRLRALEGVVLPPAAHATALDDGLVVAPKERRMLAGIEQSSVLFDRDSEEADAIREVIEQADHERAAAASAGTGTRPTELPASIDPAASPFEAKEIEGLPLTKKEREKLRHAIEEFDRERAAAAEGTR